MTDPVEDQYTRWVYPQPAVSLRRMWQACDPSLLQLHYAYWPDRPYWPGMRILVAGCGSNQAANIAQRNPQARVLGIDVSVSSLNHERLLKGKYALDNLSLEQMAIDQLDRLDETFDMIVATGVLHHLPDPAAALAQLGRRLAPHGVICVMIYGRYFRTGVYMLQELFRRLGLGQTEADVALVRQTLTNLQQDHLVRNYMRAVEDLGHDAGLVDTFLHASDRAFTVEQCLELVDQAGLRFQGWQENFYYHPNGQMPGDSPLFARLEDAVAARIMGGDGAASRRHRPARLLLLPHRPPGSDLQARFRRCRVFRPGAGASDHPADRARCRARSPRRDPARAVSRGQPGRRSTAPVPMHRRPAQHPALHRRQQCERRQRRAARHLRQAVLRQPVAPRLRRVSLLARAIRAARRPAPPTARSRSACRSPCCGTGSARRAHRARRPGACRSRRRNGGPGRRARGPAAPPARRPDLDQLEPAALGRHHHAGHVAAGAAACLPRLRRHDVGRSDLGTGWRLDDESVGLRRAMDLDALAVGRGDAVEPDQAIMVPDLGPLGILAMDHDPERAHRDMDRGLHAPALGIALDPVGISPDIPEGWVMDGVAVDLGGIRRAPAAEPAQQRQSDNSVALAHGSPPILSLPERPHPPGCSAPHPVRQRFPFIKRRPASIGGQYHLAVGLGSSRHE
ncbi:MAG: class I SAM-dependent methyltransferase [Pseudomonadota bacterium]